MVTFKEASERDKNKQVNSKYTLAEKCNNDNKTAKSPQKR